MEHAAAIISIIGTLSGVALGYGFSEISRRREEKKKKRQIACSIKQELELNIELIKLIQKEKDQFKDYHGRIIKDQIHPFRVYQQLFNRLPDLDYELFTEIKSYYDFLQIKYEQLKRQDVSQHEMIIETMSMLATHKSIGKSWDEGWKTLEEKGKEIIKKLEKICSKK